MPGRRVPGTKYRKAPNTANTARDPRRARTQLTIHGLPSQVLSQLKSRRDGSKSRSDSNLRDTKLPPTPVGGATTDQLRTYQNLRRDCPTPTLVGVGFDSPALKSQSRLHRHGVGGGLTVPLRLRAVASQSCLHRHAVGGEFRRIALSQYLATSHSAIPDF